MTNAKSMNRKKLGHMGEEFAASYLTNSGFTILKRNFRSFWGEIDIIAQKHNLFMVRVSKLTSA